MFLILRGNNQGTQYHPGFYLMETSESSKNPNQYNFRGTHQYQLNSWSLLYPMSISSMVTYPLVLTHPLVLSPHILFEGTERYFQLVPLQHSPAPPHQSPCLTSVTKEVQVSSWGLVLTRPPVPTPLAHSIDTEDDISFDLEVPPPSSLPS